MFLVISKLKGFEKLEFWNSHNILLMSEATCRRNFMEIWGLLLNNVYDRKTGYNFFFPIVKLVVNLCFLKFSELMMESFSYTCS